VGKAVAAMAQELLDLYARRKAVQAHAFNPDTVWQREFEEGFPHELTADQIAALADIKTDLQSRRVMDRLLCGDVGYGKTEVALRAAFKVSQEGRQVAILAPTTVLAFQHLTTFRARLAAWPIRVEMVSRFVSAAEIKRILEATAKGEVDILIGTHRLLSRDVHFRRLGLLVIDEEQRFGVRHKEAIKKLSVGVHTLALSATPIPRTLQLSLAGVRDLSVIETPPRNRLAIQTHLAPWSPSLAAAAIRNELRRGGQVYFIGPRVQGIEKVAADLKQLVPEAEIACAHGQMGEGQLEKVMLRFIRGEVQVLVATTIVENGIDIPRANTLLVRDAHKFGLAQLYQMRGRVGRSDVRAYAYLLVPPRRELTPEARRRLAALVEFTELGAGFRIAALDLEIRGAGEFLGARQSGHIAAVGFELYAQLLEQAVRKLSGQPPPESREPVSINLDIPSYLPEDFVLEPGQRLAIYKRLSGADSHDEVRALLDETRDRFGNLPEPALNLFGLAELRIAAEAQGAVAVDWSGDAVSVRYGQRPRVDAEKIIRLVQRDPDVRLSPAGVIRLKAPAAPDRITAAALALEKLAS
jgi:transcription-repair coupling factor (superfamily II helicase)